MWRVILVGLLIAPAAHAGAPRACDPGEGHREFRQLNEEPVPVGGSIVFGLDLAGNSGLGGANSFQPKGKTLAPGLVAVVVEADADTKPEKLPPLVAAPKIKRLQHIVQANRRGTSIEVVAELADKPPDGVVALVVIGHGAGRSWTHAPNDDGTYVVYTPGGRCQDPIPGTVETNGRDVVQLAWVDRTGRLSRLSPATTVSSSGPRL